MTLKQFLNPDWRKIIVFIFLFVVLPFLISENYEKFIWSIFYFDFLGTFGPSFFFTFSYFIYLIKIIEWFATSYLISCIIILVYNRIKNDWGSFVKFDYRKILLTLIIFSLLPIILNHPPCNCAGTNFSTCICFEKRPLMILLIEYEYTHLATDDFFFYLYSILGLIISYIISYFILSAYDKVKKK